METKNSVKIPTKKKVIPPKKPRFSTVVASAKHVRLDGSPAPTDIPKRAEISRFIGMLLLGMVINKMDTRAPMNIHMKRQTLLERGKNADAMITETATAMYSTPKRERISE